MEWWQITLIILVAIVIGLAVGLLIDYLVRHSQQSRQRRVASSETGIRREAANLEPNVENHPKTEVMGAVASLKPKVERRRAPAVLTPLLSRRSLSFLSVGLVFGVLLGAGYWAISPIPPRPPIYRSTLLIDVTGMWSQSREQERLETYGEACAFLLNSSFFMERLSQKLTEEKSGYQPSLEELAGMMTASYRYQDHLIRVYVNSPNLDESVALANAIASVLVPFMTEQAESTLYDQQQNTLEKMYDVSADLVQVGKELTALTPTTNSTYVNYTLNPAYIAVDAKIVALTERLRGLAASQLLVTDKNSAEYSDIAHQMDEVSQQLFDARLELAALTPQPDPDAENYKLTPDYLTLIAKQSALATVRNNLISTLTNLTDEYLQQIDLTRTLAPRSPSSAVALPPERIRGRYAVIMGALIGLVGGWFVLNFRALVQQLRSSSLVTGIEQKKEEEESP